MMTAISKVFNQYLRYLITLTSLYKQCLKLNFAKLIRIIVAIVSAIIFQVTSFALVAFCVHNIGAQISILGFSLSISSDLHFVIPVILLASTLFLLHALAVLYADKSTLNFSIAYEKNHINRFLSSHRAIFTLLQFASDHKVSKLRLLRGDTRAAARVLRVSAKTLTPLTTLIVSGVYLCTVQPILICLILLCSLIYFPWQRKIASSGARANQSLETLSPQFSRSLNQIIKENGEPMRELDQKEPTAIVPNEIERLYYSSFADRISAQYRSAFSSNIFLMKFRLIAFLNFTEFSLVINNLNWPELIFTFIVLKLSMSSLKAVFVKFTVISRFYFPLVRHLKLIETPYVLSDENSIGLLNQRKQITEEYSDIASDESDTEL